MDFNFFGKAFRGDKVIWCIFIALCIVSLLEVFSATSTIAYRHQNHWSPILRHATFLLIGFGLVMFLQRIPTRFYSLLLVGIPLSMILLVLTLFIGTDVNGAQRFLGIGAFTIQPSEFAKISAIGFIAFFLSKMKKESEGWIFKVVLGTLLLLCALIAPENLSTALLLFIVGFLIMFVGQIAIKKLMTVALIGSVILVVFIGSLSILPDSFVKEYLPDRLATWKARIDSHSSDEVEVGEEGGAATYKITDNNYQVSHSKIAIASGGIIGLPGSSIERDFLPQAYSDFIYSIILEETGLIGGLFVMFLYIALMIRCGVLASKTDKKFPRYLILGAALMLTVQALVNMAVAVNLIPVTGQPLPLISRGGTSTIITCAYFGIILACSSKLNDEHEDVDESIANVDFGIAENE